MDIQGTLQFHMNCLTYLLRVLEKDCGNRKSRDWNGYCYLGCTFILIQLTLLIKVRGKPIHLRKSSSVLLSRLSHSGQVLTCLVFLSREFPVLFEMSNSPAVLGHLPFPGHPWFLIVSTCSPLPHVLNSLRLRLSCARVSRSFVHPSPSSESRLASVIFLISCLIFVL